jgi:hypothetical protein
MALDPATGKLFCGAQTALISFDTRGRETVRIYGADERPPDNHHYDHWRLPDGTYGFILETPGLSYLRWNPQAETVSWQRLIDDHRHPAVGSVKSLAYTDGERAYLPYLGWLDGLTGELTPHEHPPAREASWIGRWGDAIMIRYDTCTGAASYRIGAVPLQHILHPIFDPIGGQLAAGTSCLSDCETAPPVHDHSFAILLDPQSMDVIVQTAGPGGVTAVLNHGPLGEGRWLMECDSALFVFSPDDASLEPYEVRPALPPGAARVVYAGAPGWFLMQVGEQLGLWEAAADAFHPLAHIAEGFVNRWWVHGADLTFDCGRHAAVWRMSYRIGTF